MSDQDSPLGEVMNAKTGRRDFLRKTAVAGVTVAYAAPLIETLTASSAGATPAISSPGGGTPRAGSPGYICTITKGGINNLANRFCTQLLAFYSAALSIFPGLGTVTNGRSGPLGSNPSCDDIDAFVKASNLGSACPQVEKLVALAILVGANAQYAAYAADPSTGVNPVPIAAFGPGTGCAAGLSAVACVSLGSSCSSLFGGATKASVKDVLDTAFAHAAGSGSGDLCSNSCLSGLMDAMAVDQSGVGGVFVAC